MFAEQATGSPETEGLAPALPQSIPEIYLSYVRRQLREKRALEGATTELAWRCLDANRLPRDIPYIALTQDSADESLRLPETYQRLKESSLIAMPVRMGVVHVRFVHDPLAEYLAAVYEAHRCGSNLALWRGVAREGEEGGTRSGFFEALRQVHADAWRRFGWPEPIEVWS
jgi:hypothetical protein